MNRCQICGAEVARSRTGRPPRYCGSGCRSRARTMRDLREELTRPEPYPHRHEWLQQRLDNMERQQVRWQEANR